MKHWHTGRPTLVAALALAALGGPLEAQAVVKGRVVADSTRLPLAGAEVLVPELGRRVTTGVTGGFRLDSIPLGRYTLRVRRIGFQPGVATLRVESADSLQVELPLPALIPTLEPLLVRATASLSSRDAEIAERHRVGGGRLVPFEALRRKDYVTLPDVIQDVGVRFMQAGTARIPISPRVKRMTVSGATACPMSVFLDGVEFHDDLSRIPVAALSAVEVFKSPAETPVQYTGVGRSCGVVLLWTRDR